ncbi:ankyrin repeat-containing domain protein, partial [Gautieria morchelliformis]
EKGADVNAQGGDYGNALQAASSSGHHPIVQLLLEKGADINVQGGQYGNTLQAASLSCHHPTVELLLENGADVNAQGGQYGNALQAASLQGHNARVQLLLGKGADVNVQGGQCKGNPSWLWRSHYHTTDKGKYKVCINEQGIQERGFSPDKGKSKEKSLRTPNVSQPVLYYAAQPGTTLGTRHQPCILLTSLTLDRPLMPPITRVA